MAGWSTTPLHTLATIVFLLLSQSSEALSNDFHTDFYNCSGDDPPCRRKNVGKQIQKPSLPPPGLDFGIAETESFVGPGSYPHREFAAYGVVAFPLLSTPATRTRYLAACQAYWSTLVDASQSNIASEMQMVTVWPVISISTAIELNKINDMTIGCEIAVEEYSSQTGQIAVRQAGSAKNSILHGRGPFLVAWSPAINKGRENVPVLIVALSSVENEKQFVNNFRKWRDNIQQNPELWKNINGWSVEKFGLIFREFVDSNGSEIIEFVMGAK